MEWIYNDGGRSKYFKAQNVGDCVVRAFAIASGRDYKEVYNEIKKISGDTPRNGVKKKAIREFVKKHGYEWHPLMQIGSGCHHHLAEDEIPMDKYIVCSLSGHLTAVICGTINDTYDCSRDGNRCVYGYWVVR